MKIVHLCLACFFPDYYSYQENMLPKFHQLQGHAVEVIASLETFDKHGKPALYEKASQYINENKIRVTRLEYAIPTKLYMVLKRYLGFETALNRSNPDVIFVHGCQFLDIDVVARYAKKHPATRIYVDNHADFSNSATNWLSKNLLHRIIWKRCAQIIEPYTLKFYGVLPARVDFLIDMYSIPKEKCELLVMGADDELVEAASKPSVRKDIRSKYNIAEDDFLVMTGGKIDAFKTQTLLLMEAVQRIDNPKLRLIVFGSVTEELMDRVKALADGVKVQYIGWIDAKDSYQYFAASDLVVFPGRHSVFWEQVAAQGIPMLVKDWEGTHHVDVGGNLDFLREDSVDEIEKKLLNLINHPDEYAQMKRIAMEKGRTEFLYSEIAKRSIQ